MRPFRDLRLNFRHLGDSSAPTCKLFLTFCVRYTNLLENVERGKECVCHQSCLTPVSACNDY
jgi:hypothetical protein